MYMVPPTESELSAYIYTNEVILRRGRRCLMKGTSTQSWRAPAIGNPALQNAPASERVLINGEQREGAGWFFLPEIGTRHGGICTAMGTVWHDWRTRCQSRGGTQRRQSSRCRAGSAYAKHCSATRRWSASERGADSALLMWIAVVQRGRAV